MEWELIKIGDFRVAFRLCFKASPNGEGSHSGTELVSFIHTQILVHLHVNKTNFHMKGFAIGLALKQRRNATQKSPICTLPQWAARALRKEIY